MSGSMKTVPEYVKSLARYLLVDEIADYQQIVHKALPVYMSDMRGISGCAVLGTGDVSLIVDVGALLETEFDA